MRKYYLLGIVVLGILLISCSDDTVSPTFTESFSVGIRLSDSTGTPLEGYRLSLFPKNHQLCTVDNRTQPETRFPFTINDQYYVRFIIYDYFGRHIKTLFNDEFWTEGTYRIVWDGKDDDDKYVRDGIYKIVIEYFGGDAEDRKLVFTDQLYAYMLSEVNIYAATYRTDEQGVVSEESIFPFPALYCDETILRTDPRGIFLGEYAFCDTMRVAVTDGNQTYKIHDFQIKNGANILNLNWDEMEEKERYWESTTRSPYCITFNDDDNEAKEVVSGKTIFNRLQSIDLDGTYQFAEEGIARPLYINHLGQNYPNPFN